MPLNPELERLRDDIKRTTTMREVVRLCGLSEPGRDGKIRSIFNSEERTPSLHLYEYDWYDYSTGQGGDQISFVQQALGASYMQALELLGRGMPLAVRPRQRDPNALRFDPPDYTSKFETAEDVQWTEAWDRFEAFVTQKWPTLNAGDLTVYGCKLVEEDVLWIPHYIQGKVRGIKVRNLADGSKYAVQGSCFIAGLYRPARHRDNRTHAVLVEGESDSWVLAKMLARRDVTVLALPSGAGTIKDRFIDELKGFATVGVAFDDDEPGQKAHETVVSKLETAYPIEVPGGRVAEAAADGWRL